MLGIFDSGSGGLSVLKAIRRKSPLVDIVYFGDLANIPYGSKSRAEINQLTIAGLRFLLSSGATQIINACNSMSSSLLLSTVDVLGLSSANLIEMVGPTVSSLRSSDAKRIAVIATQATVDAGSYKEAFALVGKDASQYSCPGLVDLIEQGRAPKEAASIIDSVMKKVIQDECDLVVLGCTHYPLVSELFIESAARLGQPNLSFFDPAMAVADRVLERFDCSGAGRLQVVLSASSPFFEEQIRSICGNERLASKSEMRLSKNIILTPVFT